MLISDGEDGWCGWDVGTPLADYLCFGGVDGQPHPVVSLHSCIHDSLEVLWSVNHKNAVICILQHKDPHSVQLGGCHKQVLMLLPALFLELPGSEDHVD